MKNFTDFLVKREETGLNLKIMLKKFNLTISLSFCCNSRPMKRCCWARKDPK